jgi:hypothetical protein
VSKVLNPDGTFSRVTGKSGVAEVSLGSIAGKTSVMKVGSLVTTAVTADQVVLTYTVTEGKTFYLTYFHLLVRLTTYAGTVTNFGNMSLENPSGTKIFTFPSFGSGAAAIVPFSFTEPVPIPSGTVIRVVCTPAAVTSFTWFANFGGYEK